MNIPTILDNLIAMVVVILLLSLVVQSLQSGLKKMLKIKSRQIEDSLVDLFEHVLNTEHKASGAWTTDQSPLLRLIFFGKHPSEVADASVKVLYDNVMAKFKALGRVSQGNREMLDSLAKEDLLKVLEKVGPDQLVNNFKDVLSKVSTEIVTLEQVLAAIDPSSLSGDTSAKFAKMHSTFIPLLNDFRAIVSGATVRPEVLIGDVISLRELKVDDALVVLGEIQGKLEKNLAAAKEAANPAGGTPTDPSRRAAAVIPSIEKAAKDFNAVAAALTRLRTQFDSAVAPLRGKLREVESWFDTVMQSFDERYARGMKTWAIVLSFIVVVLLNANFFRLYDRISNNETTRNALVQSEPRLKELRVAADRVAVEAKDQATVKLKEALEEEQNLIRNQVTTYTNFGFEPLSWQQVINCATGQGSWEIGWPGRIRHMVKIFLGWSVMTLLLSVGAPFWEDTLESLFGLKSLLRTGSETKNVEARSGTGQPKT